MHPRDSLRVRLVFILVAALAVILPSTAGAVVTQLGDSGWSVAVNEDWDIGVVVDDLTTDAVFIEIVKRFVGQPDEYNLMPAMYIEFIKVSEQAVGQIIITDEFVTNDTTEPWIDYHMELAVSLYDPEAGFALESDPSGDQFSTVVLSGSNGHNGLPTKFDFYNGLVPNDPPDQDDFRPGYDSGSMIIVADPQMQIDQRILLKEYPTIPEPATLGLLLFGGLALLRGRSKTR
ncbi:MAG: PEP-CTERM sorting domain-containing protein [Actinobacteria bacterium]|nr:PEP-CTERM sorting domain-containing protein [Actinomycetota bacterium]